MKEKLKDVLTAILVVAALMFAIPVIFLFAMKWIVFIAEFIL